MANYNKEISATIQQQVGVGVFMSLGASELKTIPRGLAFTARILPFLKRGKRSSRPASMAVEVTLNHWDLYDVRVTYFSKGEELLHFNGCDIDAFELPRVLLALDFDGAEVLNPRYL